MDQSGKPLQMEKPAAEAGGRKPRGRGHERRAEILAAAVRMFAERGFENVSTRAIADALGISQTTLYVYFPTKDAIFESVCEQCFVALVAAFHAVQANSAKPIDQLRAMMHAYVEFGLEHEDEYRIAFMTTHHKEKAILDGMPFEMQPAGIQCFMLISEHIAALGRAGHLRFEPELVAQSLWAAGHGLVSLLITMPHFPWCERAALITTMIESFLQGVVAGPPTNH